MEGGSSIDLGPTCVRVSHLYISAHMEHPGVHPGLMELGPQIMAREGSRSERIGNNLHKWGAGLMGSTWGGTWQ